MVASLLRFAASAGVLAVCALATPSYATVPTQFQVETDLTCQCGCGLTVHSCNHLNCGSGIPLKQEVAQQIAGGKSREEILSYFEHKYGEKILSAPTTRGFNLAAWIVPFVAIAIGGALLAFVLLRWRRSSGALAPVSDVAPTSGMNAEQRLRLERELADLDRRA